MLLKASLIAARAVLVLVARVYTDADIPEQGIAGSLLTSRGCTALVEHIIQYMYSLYSPSWGAVTTVVGYVFTDLRISGFTPLPPPPAGRPADAHLRIKTLPGGAGRVIYVPF